MSRQKQFNSKEQEAIRRWVRSLVRDDGMSLSAASRKTAELYQTSDVTIKSVVQRRHAYAPKSR